MASISSKNVGGRDCRLCRRIRAAVTLQQSLIGGREERKSAQKIFVVHLDAFAKAGAWIAGDDQADQRTVDVHLMFVRRYATTKTAAVRKLRIGCGVERDDVTCGTIGDRDWPA